MFKWWNRRRMYKTNFMENFLETLPSNSSRNLLNEWIEKI